MSIRLMSSFWTRWRAPVCIVLALTYCAFLFVQMKSDIDRSQALDAMLRTIDISPVTLPLGTDLGPMPALPREGCEALETALLDPACRPPMGAGVSR